MVEGLQTTFAMKVLLCVLVVNTLKICDSAKILAVIATPSYSHQVVFQPLWKELSLRGHNVTVLTSHPINDPSLTNLTEINLSFSIEVLENRLFKVIESRHNPIKVFYQTIQTFRDVVQAQMQHSSVQNLLQNPNKHFDLLIVEYFLGPFLFFSRKFNCPYIGVLPTNPNNMIYSRHGNPTHPILYPDLISEIYEKPNLLQRVQLVLLEVISFFAFAYVNRLEHEMALRHFQDETPVSEVWANASLLFINSDPIFHHVRSVNPSIIPIGGTIARVPVQPLEKTVKHFLDNATEGFIYFSLGSNVKNVHIPPNSLKVILETFQELPYKILWKHETSDLSMKPNNVLMVKWVSQLDVLRHPNLKLFITHGGAQSLEEAIFARIPIVGMPVFADQPFNVKKMVSKGCGLLVEYQTMTKRELKSAIMEVIQNPKYRDQIQKLGELAEDQPMTGLERAVWWTEYVIRHKGAEHLRSPLLDISWYQYYLVDVALVISCTIFLLGSITVVCIKILLYCIRSGLVKDKKKIKTN